MPLDQRHHRDDRRHRDDVAEHGHERSQLVRPDRAQRDARRFEELDIGITSVGRSVRESPPRPSPPRRRRSSRTELNGPTMTWSPTLAPDSTSKYFSPAMPVLTGVNIALLSLHDEDPFELLALLAGLQLGVDAGRRPAASSGRPSPRRGRCCRPCRRSPRAPPSPGSAPRRPGCRVAVVISAVQVKPGRTSGISPSSVTLTLKFVACAAASRRPPGSGCCRSRSPCR